MKRVLSIFCAICLLVSAYPASAQSLAEQAIGGSVGVAGMVGIAKNMKAITGNDPVRLTLIQLGYTNIDRVGSSSQYTAVDPSGAQVVLDTDPETGAIISAKAR